MALAGLVGGHVGYLALYRPQTLLGDWSVLVPGSGGACSLGMLSVALLVGTLLFAIRAPRRCLDYLDGVALCGSLGWAIGRLGCVVLHDHVSAVTTSPLALRIGGSLRYDLGLAEAILCVALFGLLTWVTSRRPKSGTVLAIAAGVYASGRFCMDFLREDELRLRALTPMQWASVAVFGAALASMALRLRQFRSSSPRQSSMAAAPRSRSQVTHFLGTASFK
jgi:prolipoprotein diacylglyceryltransferase